MTDWEYKALGDLCDLKNGYAFKSEDYVTDGVLNFRVVNINWDGTVNASNDRKYLPAEFTNSYSQYLLEEGDILFVMVGATRGKLGQIPSHILPALMNQNMWRVVPTNDGLDRDFLFFFLRHKVPELLGESEDQARGFFKKSDFRAIQLPLPPLPEQKKIAHILSTVQRAIEAQERIIQTTTELKRALMHKLFTEGLRNEPQKQTEIGPVPESWETPTVEAVCTIKASAMSYKQLEDAPNVPNGICVIGIKVSDMNLPGNEIKFRSANLERLLPEKETLKRTVPANSIVFPKRGAAIATNKKRITTGPTVLDPNLIAVIPTKAVNHRYLFHWFNTFDLKKITDPGPTPQLNKKDIAPIKFPMPIVKEQEAIAGAIDAAEEKATLHARKRDQLQDLFRTLLHELMTAKTRVNHLNIPEA